MKISSKQKQENRRKILQAAIDLIIAKGYKAATMREIARTAGVGDATIYNYFPTKETILYAYYQDRFERCIDQLKSIDEFNTFNLQEQLQAFMETNLELFLPDREFVDETFKTVFFTFSQNYRMLQPIRKTFFSIIEDIFQAAIAVEEIPDQVFRELIYQIFWDYYIGVVIYWLNDTSDQFSETSILIDKSLDLASAYLRTGIMNKMFDIVTFLFKTHVVNHLSIFKERVDAIHQIKREFMGAANESGNTRK